MSAICSPILPKTITTNLPFQTIFSNINSVLNTISETEKISFEYCSMPNDYTDKLFNIFYIKDNEYCHMQIYINKNNDNNYLIEFSSQTKRSFPELYLINEIKKSFGYENLSTINNFKPNPLPKELYIPLSREEALNAIAPIIELAKYNSQYNKIGISLLFDIITEKELVPYLFELEINKIYASLLNKYIDKRYCNEMVIIILISIEKLLDIDNEYKIKLKETDLYESLTYIIKNYKNDYINDLIIKTAKNIMLM